MGVRLVPQAGGPPIDLRRTINLIGRSDDCDVVLKNSTRVSRHHCCIAYVDDRVVVRDLGSTNGVRINGRPIVEATDLQAGDVVQIADLQFRVEPTGKRDARAAQHAAQPGATKSNRRVDAGRSRRPRAKSSRGARGECKVVRFTFEIDLKAEDRGRIDPPRDRGGAANEAAASTPAEDFPAASIEVFNPTQEVPIDPSLITPVDSDDTLLPQHELEAAPNDEDWVATS